MSSQQQISVGMKERMDRLILKIKEKYPATKFLRVVGIEEQELWLQFYTPKRGEWDGPFIAEGKKAPWKLGDNFLVYDNGERFWLYLQDTLIGLDL